MTENSSRLPSTLRSRYFFPRECSALVGAKRCNRSYAISKPCKETKMGK